MDDFFALLIFVIFISAVFVGGFYAGYRYRDNVSLERQKKYRPSKLSVAIPASALSSRGSAKIAKERGISSRPPSGYLPRGL